MLGILRSVVDDQFEAEERLRAISGKDKKRSYKELLEDYVSSIRATYNSASIKEEIKDLLPRALPNGLFDPASSQKKNAHRI